MPLQRFVRESPDGSPHGLAQVDCSLGKRFPTVLEFLCALKWADGSPRVTGTILLFAEGGVWKAALHDRDGGAGAFLSAKTLTALFESLEKALVAGSLEWRVKEAGPRRGR
jgi:hypothetical protein